MVNLDSCIYSSKLLNFIIQACSWQPTVLAYYVEVCVRCKTTSFQETLNADLFRCNKYYFFIMEVSTHHIIIYHN